VDWEVLVVDNASTDDTAGIAEQIWNHHGSPAPLRVITEPRLGLNHARWAGIHAARYAIVSFVDDDNHVDPEWLGVLARIFESHDGVGAVGAWARAVADGPLPDWFTQIEYIYGCGPQGDHAGPVPASRGFLYGAGLSLRRRALLDLAANGFSPALVGRAGANLAGGEDTELCYALTGAGWTLWYEPELRLAHYMPPGRLTLDYARRLSFAMGRVAVRLEFSTSKPRSRHPLARVRRLRLFALAWYLLSWVRAAVCLPGRRHPVGGSYDRGRVVEALSWWGESSRPTSTEPPVSTQL